MNQILIMENKKKKKKSHNSGPSDISNILKFFAIILIIFGIFFVEQGSYAIYKEIIGSNTDNLPTVTIERVNDTAVVTVTSTYEIEYLVYSWGDGEDTRLSVGGTYVEETIMLPLSNSILNIEVEEENGRTVKYQKEFNVEDMDITQPSIELTEESTEGNIKITATDETEMSYIIYQVNDEEEVRIDKSDSEDKTISYILKLSNGENIVTVTAVDTSGNYTTVEQTIVVSGQTAINLSIEDGKLIVNLEDEDGVKDVLVNLNGAEYEATDINQKSVSFSLDIVEGTNTLSITVTNVNSLVTKGVNEFEY